MIKRNYSAIISLAVCIICSVALLALIIKMNDFFTWFYTSYMGNTEYAEGVIRIVVTAFYVCSPFAALALGMLIKLLVNILNEKVFVLQNVRLVRYVSWCCYVVAAITAAFGTRYFPLFTIAFAMAVTGTLLRVMKNLMQSASELREENDLTI